jgi:hypothetical protein
MGSLPQNKQKPVAHSPTGPFIVVSRRTVSCEAIAVSGTHPFAGELEPLKAPSQIRSRDLRHRVVLPAVGADSVPHLQTMDGNVFVDLKAQLHAPVIDFDHRDGEDVLKTLVTSHNH